MPRPDPVPHRLRAWRRLRRLTQGALAARAAVSRSTIHRLEAGTTTAPRPVVARRVATALGTAPDCVAELAGAVPRLPGERPPGGTGLAADGAEAVPRP